MRLNGQGFLVASGFPRGNSCTPNHSGDGLALDGKIYNVEAEVDSHPQCRCFITPLISGFTTPASASGETWLANQDEQTQRNILGGHYDLYKSGTPLGDMVKIKQDKTWGPTVGVRPLKEMAGAGKAAKVVVPVVPAVPVLPVIPVPITPSASLLPAKPVFYPIVLLFAEAMGLFHFYLPNKCLSTL